MRVSVTEAKGQLTELVRRAEAGDEGVLTRHGCPTVRLVPVQRLPNAETRRRVSLAVARRVPDAYGQWGKGIHPTGPNFGHCFAYDVAKANDGPLLYVGDDFSRTGIASVL